ncbi:hypothetical protein M9Y10_036248 [Tritrichomonas musculus]|uniref:Uncharacterized protein n=1 Tax=Tritrichomonas musculus TaxID=1915356 RepID=A0ABR2GVM2_9EUKA
MESYFDAVGGAESDSYNYSDHVDGKYTDNNSPKEIPELIFLPDNPIINVLLEIEREESSKLILEQVDNDLWQDCVENMFRNILEKQINKLIECNLPKEIMEQVLVLKENFKRKVCTQDLEERLYNICKQICMLDAQYYS